MKSPRKPNAPLNDLSLEVLALLKAEFIQNNRSTEDLLRGYVGMSMTALQGRFLDDGSVSRVDYDLAIKALEDQKLVETGPMELYNNPPNSSITIFAMFSKREYIFLKEAGYKMADEKPRLPRPSAASRQTVNITGGQFYQSPIGVGGQVSQQLHFDAANQSDTVNYLMELLSREGQSVNAEIKGCVVDMVAKANAGDMAAVKPLYQRVFGAVSKPAKEIATGVISDIVKSSLGL